VSRYIGVAAWIVVLAVTPFVLGPYYLGLAATVGVSALLAMGLVLVTGYAGQFSLAQGAFFGVGAYGSGLLTVRLGLSPMLALVAAALVALGLAYALGRPVFRLRGHFLAMGTLALTQIFFLLATNLPVTGGSSGFGGIPAFSFLGVDFLDLDMQFWLVWALVGATLWALLRIRRSRDGRALRALRSHEAAAASCGVDVTWAKTRAFAGSAFLGSIAGSLYAHQILSIDVLSIAVIGGLASPWGAIVGAGGLEALRQGVDEVLPTLFGAESVGAGETLVVGALLVLVLVVWPGGIVGGLSAGGRRLRPAEGLRGGPADVQGQRGHPAHPVRERIPAGTTEALRATGLSKSYGGVHALSDVDLVLHSGEVLAVIGPNGAGKSTLLNLLSGNTPPTRGTIRVGDAELAGAAAHVVARHGVARSFQTPSLFGDMSVHETVLVGAHLRGRVGLVRSALPTPAAVREERRLVASADRALHAVGLHHLRDRPATELSLGQQKLVEIARALAREPDVLLLDEPGAGLNSGEKAELAGTLRTVRDTGTAVLVIEHDMEFVMGVADRVHVLDFGETLLVGSPGEVQADPAVVAAYLGTEVPSAGA
jgi:branched-chain amino acid transport system permease protein